MKKLARKTDSFTESYLIGSQIFGNHGYKSKTSSILFVELSRYVKKPPVLGPHSNNHVTLERTGCCKIHSQPNTGETLASVGKSSYQPVLGGGGFWNIVASMKEERQQQNGLQMEGAQISATMNQGQVLFPSEGQFKCSFYTI